MTHAERAIPFNGIDATSGEYVTPPMTAQQIANLAIAGYVDPDSGDAAANAQARLTRIMQDKLSRVPEARLSTDPADVAVREHLGVVPFGLASYLDPRNLAEAGWGVVFAQGADPALRAALEPLLTLRKAQASKTDPVLYQEFIDERGVRPNERADQWLARNKGSVTGAVDPNKGVPYYLLIVGEPTAVSFTFQYQLDIQYAVGRIAFSGPDALEAYRRYALSVVAAEQRGGTLARRAVFFGVQNPGDRATELSAQKLVAPLHARMHTLLNRNGATWECTLVPPAEATKARLLTLLGGAETPALLFTASHGLGFPAGHAQQRDAQGALLCQDWPGPQQRGPIPPTQYVAAADIPADASLFGLIAFCFACYGAGTPQQDDYPQATGERAVIAPEPFLAQLPQALLGHPQGGALAVIGHVDRAWGTGFIAARAGSQTTVYEGLLYDLATGLPVGAALDALNERYAELGTYLANELYGVVVEQKAAYDHLLLADRWIGYHDARGYVVLGDPAVRLPVSATPGAQRPRLALTDAAGIVAALAAPSTEDIAALRARVQQVLTDAAAAVQHAPDDVDVLRRALALAEQIQGLIKTE